MKFVYCSLLIFAAELHNIGQSEGQQSLPSFLRIALDREDYRLRRGDFADVWKYMLDDRHNGHISNLGIGNPSQEVKIQYSTASPRTWVFSTRYDDCSPNNTFVRKVKNLYNHQKSWDYCCSTEENAEFIEYGDNWGLGYVIRDTLKVKGPQDISTTEKFLQIMKGSDQFAQMLADGVISLQYNQQNDTDFVTRVCNQIGQESQFSFYFQRKLKNREESLRGDLLLCGDDLAKTLWPLAYANDISSGQWRIIIPEIKVARNNEDITIVNGVEAVFDSTTDRIYAPEVTASIFYGLIQATPIPNSNKYQIDCDRVGSPDTPALLFFFQDQRYLIDPVGYTKQITYPDKEYCEVLVVSTKDEHWTLGDTFLRVIYTIFDIKNKRVGFTYVDDRSDK